MFKFRQSNSENSSKTHENDEAFGEETEKEFSDGRKELFTGIKLTTKYLKIIAKKPQE